MTHAYEFIRIAVPKPDSETVIKRTESASDLMTQLGSKQNRELLLGCIQATIAGFDFNFTQESPAVVAAIKVIKDRVPAFPNDLKENSLELRACAAMAICELMKQNEKGEGLTTAIALRSASAIRAEPKEKHVKTMLAIISETRERLIAAVASSQRQRSVSALRKLEKLEEPSPEANTWKTIMPAIRSAMRELYAQAAADREEIDSLWWMFQFHSDLASKSVADLSPQAAAICAGVELAHRSLIPPASSAPELVRRAIETGRKLSTLEPISVQDLTAGWEPQMLSGLIPNDDSHADLVSRFPVLLPLSWACRRLRDSSTKLGKDFTIATGIPLSHSCRVADWGVQVFHERILQRVLTEGSGT